MEPTELGTDVEHTAGETGSRPEDDPGTGVVAAFGRQLKLLRTAAGMERTELGGRLGYSASSIASYEQGRRIPPPRFIERADEALRAGGVLAALKEEVARAQYPAHFRDAARAEARALGVHVYAAIAVPGLLQTEEYARAVFTVQRPLLDDDVIEQRLSARLARQDIFDRRPAPLLSFVIEEFVLRRPLGGRSVLNEQLEHILLVSQKRNVEIQVMPVDREDHAGMDGPFNLIDTAEGQRIAYTEVQDDSRMHTDRARVHELESRYGIIRSQALTPRESSAFVEKLLGER